jgi:peptide-methionine (S)-S-oxide reductase
MSYFLTIACLFTLNFWGMSQNEKKTETATFGGGCFWCTEAIYESIQGVEKVVSGYSGGKISNPTYREVTSGLTGHAEVIQITFNPTEVSYKQLLQVFFATHDPTTLNRQGADVGTQYRSAIFYHNQKQKEEADNVIKLLTSQKVFDTPIVTTLEAAMPFYVAEDYHQNYYKLNAQQPYCRAVINPKMNKFKKEFGELLK